MRTRKYDAIFLGQWCYCIASRLWLLCLSVTGLCATLYIVAKWFKIGSRLGLGWHFSRYHFQHLMPPLNSKRAVDLGVQVWYWKFGQTVADKAKLCIERYLDVMGGLSIGTTPEPLTLPLLPKPPKLGVTQNSHSNCDQTVADGAKLCIDS